MRTVLIIHHNDRGFAYENMFGIEDAISLAVRHVNLERHAFAFRGDNMIASHAIAYTGAGAGLPRPGSFGGDGLTTSGNGVAA